MWQDDNCRSGLNERLFTKCTNCNTTVYTWTSELSNKRYAEVNVRSVQAGISVGIGLNQMVKWCSHLNLSPPLTKHSYRNLLQSLEEKVTIEAKRSMTNAAEYLFSLNSNLTVDDEVTVTNAPGVSVTVDGSWQKRYGFNSLLGVVFVVSVETGEVLDFQTKHKYCFECKSRGHMDKSSEKYITWFESHKEKCAVNHTGSAESMEKEATIEMFSRSVSTRKLKYTTYVGDGDSSSYTKVSQAMESLYGDDYQVVKDDCIGHIQKRMGSNLRTYKKNTKGKLKDGQKVGGKGRLTDAVIDKLQNYYGAAIRNNIGKLKEMQDAIWASYYHCISGPSSESLKVQHKFCPTGKTSWCRYQQDVANRTSTYNASNCLPVVFRDELKPLFERFLILIS